MAFSGPILVSGAKRTLKKGAKQTSKKSARFNVPPAISSSSSGRRAGSCKDEDEDAYVEIMLDIRDDSVAVHSVHPASGNHEDPELALLAKRTLEKRFSLFGPSFFWNVSLWQVSQELRRGLASFSRRPLMGGTARRFDRTKSGAAHAL